MDGTVLLKILFFCLCFTSSAMEQKKVKIKEISIAHNFDFILKKRSVKKLSTICEFVVANNIDRNNITEFLNLIKSHNISSYENIMLLLSENIQPTFEDFYQAEEEKINNFYYSGNYAIWTQYNEEDSKNMELRDYIHALDVSNRSFLSGFYEGPYSAKETKSIAISPFKSMNDAPFMVAHLFCKNRTVTSCTFASDGISHAYGYSDGNIVVKSSNNYKKWDRKILKTNNYAITTLKLTPQGLLYSSDIHGGNYVSYVDFNNHWFAYRLPIKKPVSLILSNDGMVIALQHASKKKISIIDWYTRKIKTIKIPGNLIAITPSNNLLIIHENVLFLFDHKENSVKKLLNIPLKITAMYPNLFMIPGKPLFLLKTTKERIKLRNGYFYNGSFARALASGNYIFIAESIKKEVDVLYAPKKLSDEEIISMIKRDDYLQKGE